MNEKVSQLEQLMSQQRRIEQEDSDEASDNQTSRIATAQMSRFEAKRKAQQPRVKGPFSDDSSDQQVTPQLFGDAPKPQPEPVNLVETIQSKIKWKQDKPDEVDQLLKFGGDSAKDKKIRELAQRVKTINLALEKERTIRKKAEDQLNMAMKATEVRAKQEQATPTSTIKEDGPGTKQKLAEADKKIMEMRLANQNMKNELNKALRVIAREVGQDVNLDQLLGQENAWKGRQQKIDKLRGRIRELQQKLASNGVNVSQMSGFTMQTHQAQQQNTTVTSLADNRRKEMENLKVQVQALKSQNELLQGKVKSLTARKITVENQSKTAKEQFEKKQKLLREKSENDDRYIALLKQQNEKLKKQQRVVTKLVYKGGSAPGDSEQVPTLKLQIQKLNAQLQKRDSRIRQLAQALQNLQANQERPRPPKQKLDELAKQYLVDKKYDKQLSQNQQDALYRKWKQGKLRPKP